jgi:hypothetical protein
MAQAAHWSYSLFIFRFKAATDSIHDKGEGTMDEKARKLRLLNLFLVVLSITADLIAVTLFIVGVLKSRVEIPTNSEINILFFVGTALVYIYSMFYFFYYFSLSRVTARLYNNRIEQKKVIGLLTDLSILFMIIPFPIPLLWWYAFDAQFFAPTTTFGGEVIPRSVYIELFAYTTMTQLIIVGFSNLVAVSVFSAFHDFKIINERSSNYL